MDKRFVLILIILLGITMLWLIAVVFTTYHKSFKDDNNIIYKMNFFGSQILLKKSSVNRFFPLALISIFFIEFIPFFGIVALLFVSSFTIFKSVFGFEKVEKGTISEKTDELIHQLNMLDNDIQEIKSHFEVIRNDLELKKTEISTKEKIKLELIKEINEKEKEAKIWESMNDEQRNLVSSNAVNAIYIKSKGKFWMGFFLAL